MANIQSYVDDILAAVYGEQVRNSIADAILAINDAAITSVVLGSDNKLVITFQDGHTYTSSSLKGAKGDKGDTGQTGATGATGATGNGIASIMLQSTVGTAKTYRITYTNGSHFDFVVNDGEVSAADLQQVADKVETIKEYLGFDVEDATDLASLISANTELLNKLTYNNAGAHNAIYRGKNLGTSVTEEQYAAIAAGTFDDMYIGDYWVIDGVNWRIAAFDYYLSTGDISCNTHHVTIVPDTNLDYQQMNSSNTTAGGYTGSAMYTANMATAKNKIISAFGSAHLLTHREYLVNTVANGRPSAAAWVDSQIELMTEQNVYGGKVFAPTSDGSSVPTVHTVDKSQYPLFAHDPHMISNRQTYWLRDVVSASDFAGVYYGGYAIYTGASASRGIRPAFSIK